MARLDPPCITCDASPDIPTDANLRPFCSRCAGKFLEAVICSGDLDAICELLESMLTPPNKKD